MTIFLGPYLDTFVYHGIDVASLALWRGLGISSGLGPVTDRFPPGPAWLHVRAPFGPASALAVTE